MSDYDFLFQKFQEEREQLKNRLIESEEESKRIHKEINKLDGKMELLIQLKQEQETIIAVQEELEQRNATEEEKAEKDKIKTEKPLPGDNEDVTTT